MSAVRPRDEEPTREAPGPKRWRSLREPTGFTLTELLVAIAILVLVLASTMLVFRGVTKAWRTGQLRTERYQQARLLADLFERELSSCVVSPRYPFLGIAAAADDALKVTPDSQGDQLFFVGPLPGRSGLVERGYWVDQTGRLMCHDDEQADGDYVTTGLEEPCGSGITGLDITYFDGTQWLPQWDSRAGGPHAGQLPKAVDIRFMIGTQPGEQFETIIQIPTS